MPARPALTELKSSTSEVEAARLVQAPAPVVVRRGTTEQALEMPRRPHVVVIEERDPFPACRVDGAVAARGDALRAVVSEQPDARVVAKPGRCRPQRSVVDDAHLD
jgi:hypothetical protein